MPRTSERSIRLKTIEGVMRLMQSSGSFTLEPDAIAPHSNGYSCWFLDPHNQTTTKGLTAEEILERIEARERLEAQRA